MFLMNISGPHIYRSARGGKYFGYRSLDKEPVPLPGSASGSSPSHSTGADKLRSSAREPREKNKDFRKDKDLGSLSKSRKHSAGVTILSAIPPGSSGPNRPPPANKKEKTRTPPAKSDDLLIDFSDDVETASPTVPVQKRSTKSRPNASPSLQSNADVLSLLG